MGGTTPVLKKVLDGSLTVLYLSNHRVRTNPTNNLGTGPTTMTSLLTSTSRFSLTESSVVGLRLGYLRSEWLGMEPGEAGL